MYTFPCSPLLAASSALLSMFSMCARLSALIFLFTVRSAFQYFFLYLSFGLFELDSTNFLFGGSPVLDGMPGCDPLFLFFCRRPKKDSLVWVYAVLTWSYMVLIPVVSGSTLVSCKYWEQQTRQLWTCNAEFLPQKQNKKLGGRNTLAKF